MSVSQFCCWPCFRGKENGRCRCKCAGKYHGVARRHPICPGIDQNGEVFWQPSIFDDPPFGVPMDADHHPLDTTADDELRS